MVGPSHRVNDLCDGTGRVKGQDFEPGSNSAAGYLLHTAQAMYVSSSSELRSSVKEKEEVEGRGESTRRGERRKR